MLRLPPKPRVGRSTFCYSLQIMAKTTDTTAPTTEGGIKGILEWLAMAHGQARPEAAEELLLQLRTLRESSVAATLHTKILDLLFTHGEEVLRTERPGLLQLTLPISRKTRQKVKTLLELQETLTQEYFNTLAAHYDPQAALPSERLQSSLRRAMQTIATQIDIHHLVAAPPRSGLWQQLHAAYLNACRLGVQNLPGPSGSACITRMYSDALLNAIAQPASFSAEELAFIGDLTEKLGHLVSLQDKPPEGGGDDIFWIDPERDSPAHALVRRAPGEGIRPLYFACGKIAEEVRKIRRALASGSEPAEFSLPALAAKPAGQGVLRRLEKLWGAPARRRFPRRRHAYRARLCSGLDSFYRLAQGKNTPEDLSEWMVTNESPEGYALMHMTGSTNNLRVGDIVALQPRDEFSTRVDNWHVCIVRWAISENPEHVEIGLQMLASRALSARIATTDGEEKTTVAALLLPEAPPLRPDQSLIAPAGLLGENRRRIVLLLEQENLQIREVQTGQLSEQTGIVEIYSLHPDIDE